MQSHNKTKHVTKRDSYRSVSHSSPLAANHMDELETIPLDSALGFIHKHSIADVDKIISYFRSRRMRWPTYVPQLEAPQLALLSAMG